MIRIRLTDKKAAVTVKPELLSKLTEIFQGLYGDISKNGVLKALIDKELFSEELSLDLKSFFSPTDNFDSIFKWYTTGTGCHELLEKGWGRSKEDIAKTLGSITGAWLKKNKDDITSILGGEIPGAKTDKEASIAERLDAIATEIEKEDPRIAMAIDQISDRLEKVSFLPSKGIESWDGFQKSIITIAEAIGEKMLKESSKYSPETNKAIKENGKAVITALSEAQKACAKIIGIDEKSLNDEHLRTL